MSHFYRTHRVGASSRSRRNFFDDDVMQSEQQKQDDLKEEIAFRKEYGHYFDARDIKKFLHLKKTDPIAFENRLLNDPEIKVRLASFEDKEVIKAELVLKGQQFIQNMYDYDHDDDYSIDDNGIHHFKPSEPEIISLISDEFAKFSKVVSNITNDIEDLKVADQSNHVIENRRNIKNDSNCSLVDFENLAFNYVKEEKKISKKISMLEKDPKDLTQNLLTLQEFKSRLNDTKLKHSLIDDLINCRISEVEFGSKKWFTDNPDKVEYFANKYNVNKYLTGHFKYDRRYQYHRAVFMPSAGGKTTLFNNYEAYFYDYDNLFIYEQDRNKQRFLNGWSNFNNNWLVANNYAKEMINMYEHKFRGKILLCHSPQQLPDGFIKLKDNMLIILPSVKRWDLRCFKSNYEHLLSLSSNDYYRIMLHYRYYFWVILTYFKFEVDDIKLVK